MADGWATANGYNNPDPLMNTIAITPLAEFFDSYLPTAKGLSINTIISYQYAFQLLFEYLNEQKAVPPESITFQTLSDGTVLEYLNWLESERGCSARTRN